MNSSDNFGLNLPEQTDLYDVEHMNENTRAIDTLLNERMAVKTITVDKNLNTMRESGIYFLSQNNTHTNMPPNCTNGWLIVINNNNSVKQVFLCRGSASTHSNAYSRLLSGTGDLIGDWVRYLTELELGLFTDLELDPQATNVVQALNDLYSYCANQFANKNHTHNYAGSSSAGGSATSAVKLQTARTIRTNLASTSTASFDGTANVTPGVTGVLPVANGGTGQTTLAEAEKALLSSLPTDTTSDMMDDYSFIPTLDQQGGSGMTWYAPKKRPFSRVWTYIQDKISSVLGLSTSGYTGNSASASKLNLPSTTYGGQTQPVYFTNGKPAACSYFLSKSVPSDAKFTDTTYSNATTSTDGLMSASDKSKLNRIACAAITMSTLGLEGKTSSVADFFSALNAKGYNDNYGVLYFAYGNAQAGSITGSDITISINGCQCIIVNHNTGIWQRRNAIISKRDKTYNVWAQYDSSTTPSESGIVDLSANTWRPVQNNLTSTSTSDSLSAYQGKLLNNKIDSLIGVVSATINTLNTRGYVDMPVGFTFNNSIVVGYRFGSTYNLDYINNSTVAVYWQRGDPNNRISFSASANAVLGQRIYIYLMKAPVSNLHG